MGEPADRCGAIAVWRVRASASKPTTWKQQTSAYVSAGQMFGPLVRATLISPLGGAVALGQSCFCWSSNSFKVPFKQYQESKRTLPVVCRYEKKAFYFAEAQCEQGLLGQKPPGRLPVGMVMQRQREGGTDGQRH